MSLHATTELLLILYAYSSYSTNAFIGGTELRKFYNLIANSYPCRYSPGLTFCNHHNRPTEMWSVKLA